MAIEGFFDTDGMEKIVENIAYFEQFHLFPHVFLEIACYEQISPFPTVFSNVVFPRGPKRCDCVGMACFPGAPKGVIVWEWVK